MLLNHELEASTYAGIEVDEEKRVIASTRVLLTQPEFLFV